MKRTSLSCFAALASLIISVSAQAQYTGPVEVETGSFGEDTFSIGSLSARDGALSRDLWQGAEADDIEFLLDHLPRRFDDPAMADIFRRVLLSPGDGPRNASQILTAKKLMALAEAGFYEEAASLAELSGGLSNRPALAESVAYADVMGGSVDAACRRGAGLQSGRNTPFWLKLRFFCYTIQNEMAAADLTLGLLREQDLLSAEDEVLFTGLLTGTAPSQPILPKSGFQYAAVRQLQMPIDTDRLSEVDGAVLVALANEAAAPQQARVYAAERAAYFGLMSASDLANVFSSFEFPVERMGSARQLLDQQGDNLLVDALAYQVVLQMQAFEFEQDRAAMIAKAVGVADTVERYTALAKLYAPIVERYSDTTTYSYYAREFALIGIMAGSTDLANRWITNLATDPAQVTGIEDTVALLQLWSLRDTQRAQSIGGYAGLTITPPEVSRDAFNSAAPAGAASVLPDLVRLSLAGQEQPAKGIAGLVALVASDIAANDELEAVRQVIQHNNFRIAGLDSVYAERAFLQRAEEVIAAQAASGQEVSTARNTVASGGYPSDAIRPRVKPPANE